MREELIRRSDVIEITAETGALETQRRVKALPTIEPKTKVVAQVTFDEEKLREIVKEAVERFKEEYEIADRPQGEWVDWLGKGNEWECSVCKCSIESHGSIAYNFCPMCGADMREREGE